MESERRQMIKTLVATGVLLALEKPKLDFTAPLPQAKPAAGTVALAQETHA